MNTQSIENLQGSENTLYDTIMVDKCHLSKSIEWTTPSVNRNVNYEFWMIIICQCSYTNFTCGGCACVEGGDIWENSYTFCSIWNLKLL